MNKQQKEAKRKARIIKKVRQEAIKTPRNQYVHWKCIKCHKIMDILMSPQNVHLYTEERERKFICINCK